MIVKKPWTEEDYKRLKQLINEGASAFRAAAAMKRPVSSIRSRARKLGLSLPSIRERRQKLMGKSKVADRHMRRL